jgi:GH24 family phage-related lysozyme (muramidase)
MEQVSRSEMKQAVMSVVRAELIKTEGRRNTVYLDTNGNPTVGIGHLVKREDNLRVGDVISDDEVEAFFLSDADAAIEAAMDQAEDVNNFELDFVLALVQVNFQLGINWPKSWPNTYNKLKSNDWDGVISAVANSKWAKQTPARTEAFIKALLQEKAEMQEAEKPQLKPGITTSEFWVAQVSVVLLAVLTLINSHFGLGMNVAEIAIVVLPNIFYILSRVGVKAFSGVAPDQVKKIVKDAVEKGR